MPAKTLAPIVKLVFRPRFTRNGQTPHEECWAARTTDGVWDFEREDSPGTPWLVMHRPSVADQSLPVPVAQCGSLEQCQQFVGSGEAGRMLPVRKAEFATPPAIVWRRTA